MVNILEAQQHANKELLSEIEALKKQLADKEKETEQLKEDLKLKIGHVTGQSVDIKGEVSLYALRGTGGYKNLNKKGMDEGKLRMAVNPNEMREGAKNCKRIGFDNITIEEMLEGFIDYSNDLAGSYAGSWSTISSLSAEKYEQKQKYEEKITELNKYKEQVEDLERKLTETLSVWQKEEEEGEKIEIIET